jgi:hypothetical protein
MLLSAGDKLGPCEILASIGAGGMGEVYRARDPRVGRDVAINPPARHVLLPVCSGKYLAGSRPDAQHHREIKAF